MIVSWSLSALRAPVLTVLSVQPHALQDPAFLEELTGLAALQRAVLEYEARADAAHQAAQEVESMAAGVAGGPSLDGGSSEEGADDWTAL